VLLAVGASHVLADGGEEGFLIRQPGVLGGRCQEGGGRRKEVGGEEEGEKETGEKERERLLPPTSFLLPPSSFTHQFAKQ
jgi:hypothetical protein